MAVLILAFLTMVTGAYAQVAPIIHDPIAGAKLYEGDIVSIRWKSTWPDASNRASIALKDTVSGTMDWIAFSTPNTGEFSWTVKKWATAHTEFLIEVSDGGNASQSSSVLVSILDRTLRPTVTIRQDTKVPDQNIVKGAYQQMLGAYEVEVQNGPVIVRPAPFYVSTTTGGAGNMSGLVLLDSVNTVLGGQIDTEYLFEGTPLGEVHLATFADRFILDDGVHTLFIKGKVLAGFPFNGKLATGTSLRLWSMTDMDGNALTDLSADTVVGQVMTVRGPTLTVSFTSGKRTAIAGERQTFFGEYTLDARESSEDIRVTVVPGEMITGGLNRPTDFTNLTLRNATTDKDVTTGANRLNPVEGVNRYTIDGTGLIVPKGTIVTVAQMVNVSSGASHFYMWNLPETYSQFFSATGLESARSVPVKVKPATPFKLSVVPSGQLSVRLDPTTPSKSTVAAGGRNVVLLVLELLVSDEDQELRSLGLHFTGSNVYAIENGRYTLWCEGVQIGEGFFLDRKESQALITPRLRLPKDTITRLTVRVDIVPAETGIVKQSDTVSIAYNDSRSEDTVAVGADSGANIRSDARSRAEGNTVVLSVLSSPPPAPEPIPDIVLDVSFASNTSTEVEAGQIVNVEVSVSGRSTKDNRVPQLLVWGFTVVADGLSVNDIIPLTLSSKNGDVIASSDQPPSEVWAWGEHQAGYPEGTPYVILVTGDIFNPEFVGHSLNNETFNVSFTVPASLAGKHLTIVSEEIVATLDNSDSPPLVEQTGASITLYVLPSASTAGSGGGGGTTTIPTPSVVDTEIVPDVVHATPVTETIAEPVAVETTPTTDVVEEIVTPPTTPVNVIVGGTTTVPAPVSNEVIVEIIPDVETIEEPVAVANDLTQEVVDTVIVSWQEQDDTWFILIRAKRPLQAGEYVEWATVLNDVPTRTEFHQGKSGLAFGTGDNFSFIGFFVPKDSYPKGAGWSWLNRYGLVSILRETQDK